jgi:hypothetical protein
LAYGRDIVEISYLYTLLKPTAIYEAIEAIMLVDRGQLPKRRAEVYDP